MEAADVECATGPAEGLLGVQLHRHGGEPVLFEALPDAAGQIAEHLGVLCNIERDAVLGQGGPKSPHVAKEVRILPVAAEHTPRPRARWLRRRRCVSAELRRRELWQGEGSGIERASSIPPTSSGARRHTDGGTQ